MRQKVAAFLAGNTKQQTHNTLLPNDLANRILDLELELQGSTISKERVLELLALYSEAMEFYEERGDTKYKIFQQRIHNLLKRNEVNEVINGKAVENANRDKAIVEGRTCAERSAKEQAKAIIKFYNVQIEKQTTKIQKQLQQQKEKILERVRTRSLSRGKMPRNQTATSKTDTKVISMQKQQVIGKASNGKPPLTSNFLDQIQDFKLPERKKAVKQVQKKEL